MFTRVLPPPANIMFLLDDSGSMNFEILVTGQYDGSFPNPDKSAADLAADPHGFCYLFDDVGDNAYKPSSQPDWYAGPEGRKLWQTQFYQTNAMYYNPNVTYTPWPSYDSVEFKNGDKDNPRSHPVNGSYTLSLEGTSYTVGTVNVPHSRYVVYSAIDSKHYLVVLDKASSSKKYYTFTVTGSGLAGKISALTPVSSPPDDGFPVRSYEQERQNFANWFTYYRRREFVAKNALANVIKGLSQVRVGIYGINQKVVQPLADVNVTQGLTSSDATDTLIAKLYPYQSAGGTPLKQGLITVGSYFKDNNGTLGGVTGPAPYGTVADGGACQQSFTIIITDGYYDDLNVGFADNIDGDNGPPYADGHSKTLADIAMYYYETDLRADLPDQVPVSKYDRVARQHMTTYALAFGVSGTLDPADYDADFKDKDGNLIQWTTPNGSYKPEAVDDLWHATVNGRGKFLNAANPQALTAGLNDLMGAIAEILIGSSSSVTVNGDFLYGKVGSKTLIYQGLYSNKDGEWTGDVKAYPVDAVTGDVLTNAPKWSAAQQLQAKEWDQRLVATFNEAEGKGKPFMGATLTQDQKDALGPDYENKVKHLRGKEITGYRVRKQRLGDIVNSAPVFLDDVIYAGGNDGMLHAFDANTGAEIFAYVPNLVFDSLDLLTETSYTHRFYVDLTPTVKKGKGILATGTTDTLLVGGLRKGGKGYFGLKVTDSKSVKTEDDLAKRVLWEFPKTSDPYMGYSFSKPVIVKSNSTAYPWVVIFGNGYNSENGTSALYIVDPITGGLIKRIEAGAGPDNGLSTPIAVDPTHDDKVDFVYAGDLKGNLWKFDLRAADSNDWDVAFKQSGVQPLFQAKGPGGTVQPITTRPDVMYHPEKHGFIVCFGTGKYLGESDYSDKSLQSVYGIWDYGDTVYDLNTKKWSTDDDKEFPGVSNRPGLSNQPDKVSLLEHKQSVFTLKIGGIDRRLRFLSTTKPAWVTEADNDDATTQLPNPSSTQANHVGYYFDLDEGERVISDVIIRNELLLVTGFTPNKDLCGPGGNSMFMEINAFTGGSAGKSLFDITGDLKIDTKDLVNVYFDGKNEDLAPSGMEFFGNIQPPAILGLPGTSSYEKKYLSSSTGNIELLHEKGPKLGVAYWMEIHY
ncbi:MAG TPA: PilC/PilY family type IV pilus protein [Desulfobacterales bacterium]|nr:PilC/PilY family type IV pilus protein [Desulfobacterales bacterium]